MRCLVISTEFIIKPSTLEFLANKISFACFGKFLGTFSRPTTKIPSVYREMTDESDILKNRTCIYNHHVKISFIPNVIYQIFKVI